MSEINKILITALAPLLLDDGSSIPELEAVEVPEAEAQYLIARGFAQAGDQVATNRRVEEATAPARVGGRPSKPGKEAA